MNADRDGRRRIVIYHALGYRESWDILNFLLGIGCDRFTLTFLRMGAASETPPLALEEALKPFRIGRRPFECQTPSDEAYSCWSFNSGTRDLLLEHFERNLLLYALPEKAEDLCVFHCDRKVMEIVTHEGTLFLDLSEFEYRVFLKCHVDHSPGEE